MSLELNPVGVACNLQCPYCYEDPLRAAGNVSPGYDLAAMKRGLDAAGGEWSLFGGEPLLMRFADLEVLLAWGCQQHGHTGIQTNGTLITPAHVDLFRRCRTQVGVSIDGPDDLNDSRWAGTLEKTREQTRRSVDALAALLAAGIVPSLIVTLYRGNATGDHLARLVAWFRELDARGIRHVRLHALEVDAPTVRDAMALTDDEAVEAFAVLMALQDELKALRFDLFSDMAQLLLGDGSKASCIWHGCDPLTTPAVQGVNGVGGRSNCSRTNKDGVDWVKADAWGNERSQVLYATPQADGGCQGCRFFYACQGNCPGTAIDGDWRNRSDQCAVWFRTFEHLEGALVQLGKVPLSWPSRTQERLEFEQRLLTQTRADREHGDHWDAPEGYQHADGDWTVHGDAGTTTTHGDSGAPAGGTPTANGFTSAEGQAAAHAMVLAALRQSPPRGLVVDLGAGDGTLALTVSRAFDGKVLGIERDAAKVAVPWILVGELADVEALLAGYDVDTFLVSARRFEEIAPLEAWTRAHGRQALIYSYDEPRFARVEGHHA